MNHKETPMWVLIYKCAGVVLLFAGPVLVVWINIQSGKLWRVLKRAVG